LRVDLTAGVAVIGEPGSDFLIGIDDGLAEVFGDIQDIDGAVQEHREHLGE
jgi:hypothetical protein